MAVLALPGWSLSLTHRLPIEAVALTMTSRPRSSGKCNKPLAALVMTHIPVSNATSSRLNTPGWESPISSGHGAPAAMVLQDVVGMQWGSNCSASLGSQRWQW